MKKLLLLFIFLASFTLAYSQKSDASGTILNFKKTEKLKKLYQEAKAMGNEATSNDINTNRLAIKKAWQEVNPAIAALYKSIDNGGASLLEPENNIQRNEVKKSNLNQRRLQPKRSKGTRNWGVDATLRNNMYVDGVDMEVTTNEGIIYIATFTKHIAFGTGDKDSVFVFKSTNHGGSFTEFIKVGIPSALKKVKLISIDANTGGNYITLFTLFDSKTFQVLRWTESGSYQGGQVIASDVVDFDVDRNWTDNTTTQRIFATYQKSDFKIYSARSTAGSFGYDWIDEFQIEYLADQGNICYGKNGAVYLTAIGHNSHNLYAKTNTNYNDPASWEVWETLQEGSTTESLNPKIIAARNELANDKVMVLCSSRVAGSTEGYNGKYFLRENTNPYTEYTYMNVNLSTHSIAHLNAWVKRHQSVAIFQTSYIIDRLDNTTNDGNRSRTYNGTSFEAFEPVASIDVYDGFATAIAETKDGLPCVAYAGTSSSGYGKTLYFDAKSNLLEISNNVIDGFTMYPNPVNDILNIETTNPVDAVSIYNMLGQEVISTAKTQIDMSALPAGSYVVKVQAGAQIGAYSLIKE